MSRELIKMSLENLITVFTHLGCVWELKHAMMERILELMTSAGFVVSGDPSPYYTVKLWLANDSVPMCVFYI
jgi:hypothetical protein